MSTTSTTSEERVTLESSAVSIHRPAFASGWLGLASFALFLTPFAIMMIGGGLFGMSQPWWWAACGKICWWSAPIVGVLGVVARIQERSRPGRLSATGTSIRIERGAAPEEVPRGMLLGGTVTPLDAGAQLSLELDDGRMVRAQVPSVEAAERALETLGVAPAGRRFKTAMRSGSHRIAFGVLGAVVLILAAAFLKSSLELSAAAGGLWLTLAGVTIVSWLGATRAPEIAVGADGVRWREAWRPHFLPWSELAGAEVNGLWLVLTRQGGEKIEIRAPGGGEQELRAALHAIEKGLAASQTEGGARTALLDRHGRPVDQWRAALARVGEGDVDYRRATLSRPELIEVLTAHGARVEHRLGAAMALRAADPEAAGGLLRIAAERCADPRVRVALTKIAEGEDEEAAVLEALATEPARREAAPRT